MSNYNLPHLSSVILVFFFLDRRDVHVLRSSEIANNFSGREIASSTDTR